MVAHLGRVLAAAVADPGLPVSRLPLLDEEEQRLLDSFNDTAVDYGPAACLHETISRQAARTPDAVAVRHAGADLTYAQLDRRANQLARHLIDLGAGPDRLVGICAQRSTELVVALLATLKAGAAYVPLDPDHPRERLRYLIDDTDVPVVLTQHHLTDRLPDTTTHLALDTDWPTVATHPDTPPETTVTPDNLAYVIYTSGSTGKPKGVMVEHRAIDNRLRWMQHTYPLHAHDAVLQKTPYTFDVSVWEFFWPLMVGARLVLARPEGHRDNAYLTHTITSENITTVHFVPAMLRHFLNHLDTTTAPTTLTRVFCSGEALTADLRDRFFTHLDAELHNLYGPTEAAVDVTYWQCHPHHTDPTIPIGRPIANTQCHVLDPHHQPTPIGIPGELHLAGTCLARGYHHRDDLTHHTFITHPTTGQRLYRTGDIATWNPDGTLEYLGRNDHQVKINGQRIELGEIENTLTTHPHITHAIAGTHQPDPHTTPHLIAWITTDHPHPDQLTTDLRTWLTDHLPLHLIPATITPITHLPLTTSGKIDRKQLPLPTHTPTHHRPHTPTEHTLATIWTTLTNNPNPQPHDNFFTTGGNSLHAIQLITHIHNHFHITLPLRTLYTHPTLTTMATTIDTVRAGGADRATASSLVPLRAEGSRTPLHLVHPVGGSVVPYLPLVALLPTDLPVWGFEAAGLHDGEPCTDLPEMAARYVAELRRRQPHGPYRLGGWSFGGMVAYEMARRLTRDGERVELLLLMDTSSPAGDGPLPDDTDLLIDFAEDVAALQDADVPALDRDRLAELPPEERTAAVLAALRERGLVPAEAVDEMARRSAVFRANALAFRRYRPAPYDGVVSLLTAEGSGDHHARRWIEANLARVEHRRVPGTHYSMLREPHLTGVASTIADLNHGC
ncbi:amino acid adenylation domain-containing protein [Micromonospora tulbaghiae]|uniref:amino acid adenylation domain-containing protein n=1 Tax=Micromonospora tulbaghiae TaxID=479978 RepID=UPI001C2FF7A6|nr:amino acid adenylation domain-containing protein [Micromonospora tulbaghiae]